MSTEYGQSVNKHLISQIKLTCYFHIDLHSCIVVGVSTNIFLRKCEVQVQTPIVSLYPHPTVNDTDSQQRARSRGPSTARGELNINDQLGAILTI